MSKKSVGIKIISCAIIVAALFYYNQMMKLNDELLAANKKLEQVATQAGGLDGNSVNAPGPYVDGTYSGTAQGYGGPVTTELTIENGNITGIEITSSDGEDAAYYNMCLGILDKVVETQGADVDTVSGATYTSNGIINGVKDALSQAGKS